MGILSNVFTPALAANASKGWWDETFAPAAAQSKDILYEDVKRMRANQLGMTDLEKGRMQEQALQSADVQGQAQTADIARQSMAGESGLGGMTGAAADLQRNATRDLQNTGAKASLTVDQMDKALQEARRNEILARLAAQQDRGRENAQAFASPKAIGEGIGALATIAAA